MKRILSLTLSCLMTFVGFVSLAISPALGQEQIASLSQLREQISVLEKVENDPATPLDVKEINRTFLEERRIQFRTVIQKRLDALKRYQATVSGVLTTDENRVIISSVQSLEKDLQNLIGDTQPRSSSPPSAKPPVQMVAQEPQPAGAALILPRTTLTFSKEEVAPVKATEALLAQVAPASTPSPVAEGTPKAKVTLCGQVSLASLNETLGLIKSAPAFKDIAKKFRPTDMGPLDPVIESSLDDDCDRDNKLFRGRQKNAVVDMLKDVLTILKGSPDIASSYNSSLSPETVKKQIVLLEEYLGNVKVNIEKEDGTLEATPLLDRDGNYEVEVAKDTNYIISTEGDDNRTRRLIKVLDKPVRVNLLIEDRPVSLLTRAVVGYEQSGAAAARKEQNYFFDLFISKTLPIAQKIDPDFGERLRTWGDIRIDSIPQPGTATIGELTSGFVTNVSGLAVKDAANVFDFQAGFEFRLTGNKALLPSFDRRTKQKFTASLIASIGAITPTEPQQSITTFKVFPAAPGLPPEAKNKEFVAFVSSDRDRFFRQYYAGLRLQTFFFNQHNVPMQRFPAQLDIAVGQNEFVSGGRLSGPVFRFDGYFPLPYDELQFINIYGTALLRPGRAQTGIPLILQPAPAGTVVPGANVALIEVRQINRDYYRAGIGIDLISFVKKLREGLSKK